MSDQVFERIAYVDHLQIDSFRPFLPPLTNPCPVSISQQFPDILSLRYQSTLSQMAVMSELQKAHWHFLDHLAKELHLAPVGEEQFWTSALYHLAKRGVDPFYEPRMYIGEWTRWLKYSMVGGAALVRCTPNNTWEVLMVKCYKPHLQDYSSTWAGGKADPTDQTLWDVCVREVQEEIGLDISGDRPKVVAVIENRKVYNAVIILDYDDPRLQHLKKKDIEIHEIVWSPLLLDMDQVRTPRRLHPSQKAKDDGIVRAKVNTKDLRMPEDFQNSYRMLQDLYRRGVFSTPAPNVDEILSKDPKEWMTERDPQHRRYE